MGGDNVMANVQTYAAVLELYGQLKDVKMIKDTCVKMNSQVRKPENTSTRGWFIYLFIL